ncbi:GNAT family N-acetyltransferase [Candidatus Odyssella acanthamoebae]|nr:GNAT family N-acetyltransferase [Candidatus Paracaedibacter acanthamoebae]
MDKDIQYNPKQDLPLSPYKNFMASENTMLRPLFPEDYKALCPIYTNAEVVKYFGPGIPLTIEEIKKQALARAQRNDCQKSLAYHWAILAHGGIAGSVSIFHPHDQEERTEIFYCISPAFGGRGLATAASRLVIEFVGGPFIATVHPKNKASMAILERKLGFKRDLNRQNVEKYGTVRDYFLLNEKE